MCICLDCLQDGDNAMNKVIIGCVAVGIDRKIVERFRKHDSMASILLVETPEQSERYSPSRANNEWIRRTCEEHPDAVIVKTDVDCVLSESFIDECRTLQDKHALFPFINFEQREGGYKLDINPCGTCAMHAKDWQAMNGYDERMWGHGREDGDLLDRCLNAFMSVKRTRGHVRHLWHEPRLSEWYPRRREENMLIHDEQGLWSCKSWGL